MVKKICSHPGSNQGPSVYKADVIANTLEGLVESIAEKKDILSV